MSDLKTLLDACKAEAIANKLDPTEASWWRSICREYSKKFHTALPLVYEMDPEHVVLEVYEDQLEDVNRGKWENIEQMLENIGRIEDPDYDDNKEKRLQAEMDRYEAEEEERLKKKAVKKTLLKKEEAVVENLPTGGFVDLSALSKEDLSNEE